MKESLSAARTYLLSGDERKSVSHSEAEVLAKNIKLLEHVLQFSATWNGVPTGHFFPRSPELSEYLSSHDASRLGEFFAKPFAERSKELRAVDAKYPSLLKKLYEEYYLRTIQQGAFSTAKHSST